MNHTILYSTVGVNKSFEFLDRKKKVNKEMSLDEKHSWKLFVD